MKNGRQDRIAETLTEWIPLYENLPLSPDVLLSDMIKAFHPELLPDYHPVFYSLLEKE